MICCSGATFPRVNFITPGQVHRHLITTNLSEFLQFLHKLLQRMNFKHVYLFLVLYVTFIEKFIPNINNEHAQDYSCPGQLLRSVHMKKSYLGKAGYPVLSVTGVRPCAEAKLTPGSVSCPEAMSCPGIM